MAQSMPPLNILEVLDGAPFPLSAIELIDYAQENDASEDVLDQLQAIPERIYNNIYDVNRGLNEIEALPGSENLWASNGMDEEPEEEYATDAILPEIRTEKNI